MGMYVSDGNIYIGFEMFSDIRKKPCIVVREGNETTILGTFKDIECAVYFIDKLAGLTRAKESEGIDKC